MFFMFWIPPQRKALLCLLAYICGCDFDAPPWLKAVRTSLASIAAHTHSDMHACARARIRDCTALYLYFFCSGSAHAGVPGGDAEGESSTEQMQSVHAQEIPKVRAAQHQGSECRGRRSSARRQKTSRKAADLAIKSDLYRRETSRIRAQGGIRITEKWHEKDLCQANMKRKVKVGSKDESGQHKEVQKEKIQGKDQDQRKMDRQKMRCEQQGPKPN